MQQFAEHLAASLRDNSSNTLVQTKFALDNKRVLAQWTRNILYHIQSQLGEIEFIYKTGLERS